MPKTRKPEGKKVIHEDVVIKLCRGEKAVTAEQAKKLLGWEEEGEEKFGSDYQLKDNNAKKIRCSNNMKNRPLYMSTVEILKQEILRKKWQLNLENIIIGRTGLVLNGQHRLIALVLAYQCWESKTKFAWDESVRGFRLWETEPTIETVIAFGACEDDSVVNTMDTCKPRTLADVIFRSQLFESVKMGERKTLARITDYSVKLLWHRTGVENAFAIRRTHAESLDFITRHPKILECVQHIFVENQASQGIKKYISTGYASGLLYLMGCSTTTSDDYYKDPRESSLEWQLWDKASNFWVSLAASDAKMLPIQTALGRITQDDEGSRASIGERCALVIKAWNLFLEDKPLTEKALRLEYHTNEDGIRSLNEHPTVGGIDLGTDAPGAAEIAERADIERRKREAAKKKVAEKQSPAKKTAKKKTAKKKSSKTTTEKAVTKKKKRNPINLTNKIVWFTDKKEDFKGVVTWVGKSNAKVKIAQGFQGAGNIQIVAIDDLRSKQ